MSAVIGALRAELSASIAQFQSDMGKAADSLKGFTKQAKAISRELDSVGKSMSLAITAPLALLAKAGLDEAKQAREAMGQVQAALDSTGGASGRTAAQLQKSAKQLQNLSTFDDDDILRNVTANLLTFSNVQGEVFDKAQKSIINLATRMGGDLAGAAVKVGRALQDPIKGTTALTRLGVSFTSAEAAQIKALVQHGKGLEAQGIILDRLQKKFGGAAEAMRAASPDARLAQSWRDFKETIGTIEIQLLPALTDKLRGVLDLFQSLSPATQKWVVQAAALLAIVGPVLVIFGKLVTAVRILVPVMKGLWVWFSGLSAVTIGWVVALAAVALAVVIFWKTIRKALGGDFKGAWEEAQKTATSIAKKIKGTFSEIEAPKMPGEAAPGGAAPGPGGKPGKLDFNLNDEADIKRTQKAADALKKSLLDTSVQLQHGLDSINLPKATADANQFNAKLDEYLATAKDAGVNTAGFATQVAALRLRIKELQDQGLVKEAEKFAQAVDADAISVRRFASGGLDPLTDKLEAVNTEYQALKDHITQQIEENKALADVNDDAARNMAKLVAMLGDLEAAHDKATKAAENQVAAERGIAHLQAEASKVASRAQIEDFKAASGRGGAPLSDNQERMQKAQRDLDASLIEAETKYQDLANQRLLGEETLSAVEKKDLEDQMALQKELADLIGNTNAEQIVAAGKVNEAFKTFTDDLTNNLTDSIKNWSFNLEGLTGIFRQLGSDLFIKPIVQSFTDSLASGIRSLLQGGGGGGGGGGLIGSLFGGGGGGGGAGAGGGLGDFFSSFSGMFADGGMISPGKWGIVGENGPEPVFGGASGVEVHPNGSMGGNVTQVFNVSTPDANSFRRSQRQIQRSAKSRLAL